MFNFKSLIILAVSSILILNCKKKSFLFSSLKTKDSKEQLICDVNSNFSMTRRLTNDEYSNSLNDILFINSDSLKSLLPIENASEGFKNSSLTFYTSEEHVLKYEDAAKKAVEDLSNNRKFFDKFISSCLEGKECEIKFVKKLGSLLFRRPITDNEIEGYLELYRTYKEIKNDFIEGSKFVVSAMLMSPHFLFKIEKTIDDTKNPRHLDNYELATRMAFLIWRSSPDEELLELASKNQLTEKNVINKQVDRMLIDPKGKRAFIQFISEWLNINQLLSTQRSKENFPQFTEELALDMITEVQLLLSDYVYDQDRSLLAALQTPYTYLSPRLAKFYGMAPKGEGFQKYSLENNIQRFGLLSTSGFLTGMSPGDEVATIGRGLFMARKFLCQEVPPPPAAALAISEATSKIPIKTPKERLKIHAQPTCSSCHQFIDPLGLGLEQYDSIGGFRTVYKNGEKIMIEEYFSDGRHTDKFKNLKELSEDIKTSQIAYSCYLKTMMQYAYQRIPTAQEECEKKSILAQHISTEMGYKTLLKILVNSSNFRYIKNQP